MSEWSFKHFKKSEFACRCGCGFDTISEDLVARLEDIRLAMQTPLKINSGCRCVPYNSRIGGELNSSHTRGLASDIMVPGPTMRYVLTRLAFKYGFKRIGQYPTFVHLDVDDTLPQHVMWFGARKSIGG